MLNREEPIYIVLQGVITLPYLNDEVLALYTADNRSYIPAFAVCHALGFPATLHIRKWYKMLLWVTSHKIPLKTKRGTRNVRRLLISEVPFLYANMIWKYVSGERRQQLYDAIEKGMDLAYEAYQYTQQEYYEYRQSLFTFLCVCAAME